MNEFKLIGNVYVSKSGNNANDGLTPDTPVLDISVAIAIANTLSGTETIVIGAGIYEIQNINTNTVNLIGDGVVIFRPTALGTGTCISSTASNSGGNVSNIIFTNYINNINVTNSFNQQGIFENCTFIGGNNNHNISRGNLRARYIKCKFVNCSISTARSGTSTPAPSFQNGSFLDQCVVYNTNWTITNIPGSIIQSNFFFNSSIFNLEISRNNFTQGTSSIVGSIENTNNNSGDPLFLGDPLNNLEFTVANNSPLIGQGLLGINIGDVRTGNLQNSNSTEWGTSPQDAGTTSFGTQNELVLASGTSSTREAIQIDLGQIRNSPIIKLNGLVDFLNNVPDNNNTLQNPNHLTFEAQWAGIDNIFNGVWRPFRWNERLQLDILGNSNGETGFDWGNTVDIQLRYILIRTTIRNDYNVA